MTTIVTPGDVLGPPGDHSGAGTYLDPSNGQIISSLTGSASSVMDSTGTRSWFVASLSKTGKELLPNVGDVVSGRVTRVTRTTCEVQILCVGDAAARGAGFKGTLRRENVRLHEIDSVDVFECFKQGDVVKAVVVALGGARSYELGTGGNALGVIHATCTTSGVPMVPISWTEMKCPSTGVVEKRKVAKVEVGKKAVDEEMGEESKEGKA